jgi:hypothetical protein
MWFFAAFLKFFLKFREQNTYMKAAVNALTTHSVNFIFIFAKITS